MRKESMGGLINQFQTTSMDSTAAIATIDL